MNPVTPSGPVPSRRAIATTAAVTLIAIASILAAALRDEWMWTVLGATVTVLLSLECIRDINNRRRGHPAR